MDFCVPHSLSFSVMLKKGIQGPMTRKEERGMCLFPDGTMTYKGKLLDHVDQLQRNSL